MDSVEMSNDIARINMGSWPGPSRGHPRTDVAIAGEPLALASDPFSHIDSYILELMAKNSGISYDDGLSSHSTLSGVSSAQMPDLHIVGQNTYNTKHINSVSEDATESEGHAGVSVLAESSTGPAYWLARPRAPTKAKKERKEPQRPRAPAIKAARSQVMSKGTLRCEMCDRDKYTGSEDYAHQASLNRHIRTSHLDRSRWQCTLCDKSMVRSDALGRHLKRQHHMSEVDAKAVVGHVAASKYLTD